MEPNKHFNFSKEKIETTSEHPLTSIIVNKFKYGSENQNSKNFELVIDNLSTEISKNNINLDSKTQQPTIWTAENIDFAKDYDNYILYNIIFKNLI